MFMLSKPLIAVFDNYAHAEHAVNQLHHCGISRKSIQCTRKTDHWKLLHMFSRRYESFEALEADLESIGISMAEIHYYERAYEAGMTLLVVRAGIYAEQAKVILASHGGYDYATHPQLSFAPATGSRMRIEDSSQPDTAFTSDGVNAVHVDSQVIDADVAHALRILNEKNKNDLHP
ncbi:hypothetical protein [Dictyobacter formicarum]|uniref:Uncharacterized protein n=1 Tax=Dictyobacter formicarum TaxID=2778368 RepID=A0ABQ3VIY5_9CHLR|nr:hypothetical protein [Dictyobacter formicarum]GHO86165.1 hypothetical protein KSZ_41710 [Dictyobacter formicarum]